jgi:hypothetical protein
MTNHRLHRLRVPAIAQAPARVLLRPHLDHPRARVDLSLAARADAAVAPRADHRATLDGTCSPRFEIGFAAESDIVPLRSAPTTNVGTGSQKRLVWRTNEHGRGRIAAALISTVITRRIHSVSQARPRLGILRLNHTTRLPPDFRGSEADILSTPSGSGPPTSDKCQVASASSGRIASSPSIVGHSPTQRRRSRKTVIQRSYTDHSSVHASFQPLLSSRGRLAATSEDPKRAAYLFVSAQGPAMDLLDPRRGGTRPC